jgi:formamidopyrimidine-DNA glycosylase
VPELPEVERARAALEAGALGREIVDVNDSDAYVCRPHAEGEIAAWLVGRRFTAARRQGKAMWLETDGADGPRLGLHLGMAGAIVIDEPPSARGWDRFSVTFADGGRMALRDRRRLGRVRLDPDHTRLGPDAATVGREAFRRAVGRGTAPLKARIMSQSAISGVGNLLADEALWQARLSPLRPAGSLSDGELDALRRAVRAAIRTALARGGAHTGTIMPHRRAGASCPRCGAPMERGTVGGRTTWWCSAEQAYDPKASRAVGPVTSARPAGRRPLSSSASRARRGSISRS